VTVLFSLVLVGCNALPPGEVSAIHALAPTPAASPATAADNAAPPVILLRGWRDLWSDGIDVLAEKLRAEGIEAAVFKQSQSGEVGDALLARAKAGGFGRANDGGGGRPPFVLIGFSFGADDSIRTAARLNEVGCPVDLLVLIDPVTPPPIPPNVRRCANFYQSNGAWDVFPWLRGVPVETDPADPRRVTNVDLRDRPDLLEPGTAHRTIAANPKLHAAVVAEVRAALGRAR
jgi:pimeloyl-ACP methyl ester carboxylesterase